MNLSLTRLRIRVAHCTGILRGLPLRRRGSGKRECGWSKGKAFPLAIDGGNAYLGGHNIKNNYLGEPRIVTKLAAGHETTVHEEVYKQFYYHAEHLGSAALITDYRGYEYQRLEYTPYGEIWVEEQKVKNEALIYLPGMGGVFNHINNNLWKRMFFNTNKSFYCKPSKTMLKYKYERKIFTDWDSGF